MLWERETLCSFQQFDSLFMRFSLDALPSTSTDNTINIYDVTACYSSHQSVLFKFTVIVNLIKYDITRQWQDTVSLLVAVLCFCAFYVWCLASISWQNEVDYNQDQLWKLHVHTIHMTSSAKTSVTRNLLSRLGAVLMVSLKVKRNLNFLRCSVFRYFETSCVYEDC